MQQETPCNSGRMPAAPRVVVAALVVLALLGAATLAFVQFRDRDSAVEGEFVAIEEVPRQESAGPAVGPDASTGSFSSPCGRNENGHRNHDNMVTSPGESGGAHHMHEYVGNLSTDAYSTESSLASAGTTCTNGDKSAYFWPVLRTGEAAHGGHGGLVEPASVLVRFHGNPTSKVVPMPRFLRIGAGDARAATSAYPPRSHTGAAPAIRTARLLCTRCALPGIGWSGRSTSGAAGTGGVPTARTTGITSSFRTPTGPARPTPSRSRSCASG